MLTFQNLQDEVLGWLDEGDNTDASATTLARVKSALNAANAKRASSRRWKFMVQEPPLTFSTVAGTRTYTLDSTVHVPIYFWNDTKEVPLTEANQELVPSRSYDTGTLLDDYLVSSPQYGEYVLGAGTITLQYEPTGVDVISYGFYKKPTVMVADADLPDIPYPHSQILVSDALLKMAAYNEDTSGAKISLWTEERDALSEALDSAYGQENSQWTAGQYIQYIPRD